MMAREIVNVRDMKQFEGRLVKFKGDAEMAPRSGIITDVIVDNKNGELRAVVLWDEDEFQTFQDNGKEIKEVINFDMGVSTYPLVSLCNKQRFQIT